MEEGLRPGGGGSGEKPGWGGEAGLGKRGAGLGRKVNRKQRGEDRGCEVGKGGEKGAGAGRRKGRGSD